MDEIKSLFDSAGFMPHGFCYLWTPAVLWLNVGSDIVIAVAYFSIPLALLQLVRRRKDLVFGTVFRLFGAFILLCGATHLFAAYTTWVPLYGLAGLLKLTTAGVSIATAAILWPLLPKAVGLPSPTQMRFANLKLESEIDLRRKAEEELLRVNASLNEEVQKRTEELAQAVDKLKRSNDELEQFAYVASHDLQEPLRMVSSFVQLLDKRLEGRIDDEERRWMGFAVDGAHRMQRMIHDLLEYSRAGFSDNEEESAAIEPVLEEVRSTFESRLEDSGGTLEIDAAAVVRVPRSQLVQLFTNLLDNALKYAGEQPPAVEITAETGGDRVHFTVTDHGIGIPAEETTRVFGLFKRLHDRDAYPGTGIGLAVVKRVVERHGGTIQVEPVSKGGTCFRFDLPAAVDEGAAP